MAPPFECLLQHFAAKLVQRPCASETLSDQLSTKVFKSASSGTMVWISLSLAVAFAMWAFVWIKTALTGTMCSALLQTHTHAQDSQTRLGFRFRPRPWVHFLCLCILVRLHIHHLIGLRSQLLFCWYRGGLQYTRRIQSIHEINRRLGIAANLERRIFLSVTCTGTQ